ncbi:MAG: hypothetical protein H7Y36_08790 [Armatimonadetes bacterium]|nr:hypothetical protein [Akkermansiaceae bacterium]
MPILPGGRPGLRSCPEKPTLHPAGFSNLSKASAMNRVTPKMRELAERLIAYETKGRQSPLLKTPVSFPVSEKLRPRLTTLMGKFGFHALLSRALALAGKEVPWLRAFQVNAEGSLESLDKLEGSVHPDEIFEGRVVLIAQLLGLLEAFVGEKLTLNLLREEWPSLAPPPEEIK